MLKTWLFLPLLDRYLFYSFFRYLVMFSPADVFYKIVNVNAVKVFLCEFSFKNLYFSNHSEAYFLLKDYMLPYKDY